MNGTRAAPAAWLAIVGLAGSFFGFLEALWQVWYFPPLSSTEAVLVLAWASVAYAVPAILFAAAWIGIVRVRNRSICQGTGIPAALIPLGFFVGVSAMNILWAEGFGPFRQLLALAAGAALAFGLCFFLYKRWPAHLSSVHIWLLLHGLLLSAALGWLAVWYVSGGQMLAMVLLAVAAAACCLWAFASPLRRRKAVVAASALGVTALTLPFLWPLAHTMAMVKTGVQRNVLLITIDTLRADHLGSYGYARGQTPTMDRLAAEGVVFEEAHAQSPFTCPSHASILTGLDPFQHGAFNNGGTPLGADVVTLPKILSPRGYETAAFVSASPVSHTVCGLGAGFHIYEEDFGLWRWLPQSAMQIRGMRMLKVVAKRLRFDFERYERPAAETTNAVLDWLEQRRKQPFFLWVHFFDPHLPFTPPVPFNSMFDPDYTGPVDGHWYFIGAQAWENISSTSADLHHMIALYDGEVAYVDNQIRRLRDALARLGLDRTTLVILTSDHGESHGEHNRYFARDLYRPSLHVPLIFAFPPGEVQPHRVTDQVRLIDITPTVLDYLQIEASGSLEGKSLLPLIRGADDEKGRPAYAIFPTGQLGSTAGGMFALQDKGYKLIWSSAWWYADGVRVPPREELYDVQADPQEEINVLVQKPPVLPDLRRRLTDWREQKPPDRRKPTGEVRTILKSLGYVR
jgi:arylsulfatase A-like enzyme